MPSAGRSPAIVAPRNRYGVVLTSR
jgi:hypothetical protein